VSVKSAASCQVEVESKVESLPLSFGLRLVRAGFPSPVPFGRGGLMEPDPCVGVVVRGLLSRISASVLRWLVVLFVEALSRVNRISCRT